MKRHLWIHLRNPKGSLLQGRLLLQWRTLAHVHSQGQQRPLGVQLHCLPGPTQGALKRAPLAWDPMRLQLSVSDPTRLLPVRHPVSPCGPLCPEGHPPLGPPPLPPLLCEGRPRGAQRYHLQCCLWCHCVPRRPQRLQQILELGHHHHRRPVTPTALCALLFGWYQH